MTLSHALAAHVAQSLGVDVAAVSVGVSAKGEIVAKVKGWNGRVSGSCRVQCYLKGVPDDYDPIAAGDGEWSAFPP